MSTTCCSEFDESRREADLIRKGAALAGAYFIGSLKRSGKLDEIWGIPGVPKIISISLIANGLAMLCSHDSALSAVLDGIGESTLAIASYEWGNTSQISGFLAQPKDVESAARDLEVAAQAQIQGRRRQRLARAVETKIRRSMDRDAPPRSRPAARPAPLAAPPAPSADEDAEYLTEDSADDSAYASEP